MALVCAVLVGGLLAGCDPRAGTPTTVGGASVQAPAPREIQRDVLFDAINAERARAGLPAFRLNPGAALTARAWSAHLARSRQLDHRSDLGPALSSRGVAWSTAGENVGAAPHALQVLQNFMASAPHRANILSSRFTDVGVGVTASGGLVWVTVNFVG